jgi:hypothetical protein
MSTSVTHNLRGNAGAMKTPTAFSDNTSPKAPIYLALAKLSSALSHANSTSDQERPCYIRHQQRNLKHVLQRPVETAGPCGRSRRTLNPRSPPQQFRRAGRKGDIRCDCEGTSRSGGLRSLGEACGHHFARGVVLDESMNIVPFEYRLPAALSLSLWG